MRGFVPVAELMKALSHPVRLQIMDILEQEGEACVCHVEARLNQRQAYISQQLARLREAGLVKDRREGLNVYYGLASEMVLPLLDQVKRTASAISRVQGVELNFKPLTPVKPEDCSCPKCQEAMNQIASR